MRQKLSYCALSLFTGSWNQLEILPMTVFLFIRKRYVQRLFIEDCSSMQTLHTNLEVLKHGLGFLGLSQQPSLSYWELSKNLYSLDLSFAKIFRLDILICVMNILLSNFSHVYMSLMVQWEECGTRQANEPCKVLVALMYLRSIKCVSRYIFLASSNSWLYLLDMTIAQGCYWLGA